MLAHELRNPLAPILNAAQVLNTESPSKADVSWAAGVISRQAQHMGRMLEDLLDASRVVRKKLELRKEYLDIVKVIQSAVEATQSLVEVRGHELLRPQPGGPLYVHADPTRLEQVVVNLISNAAKYTQPHGRIEIGCRSDGANILVSVKDNGIGIDRIRFQSCFSYFRRYRAMGSVSAFGWCEKLPNCTVAALSLLAMGLKGRRFPACSCQATTGSRRRREHSRYSRSTRCRSQTSCAGRGRLC